MAAANSNEGKEGNKDNKDNTDQLVAVGRLTLPLFQINLDSLDACLDLCKRGAVLNPNLPWTLLTHEGDVFQGTCAAVAAARDALPPNRMMSTYNIQVGPMRCPSSRLRARTTTANPSDAE